MLTFEKVLKEFEFYLSQDDMFEVVMTSRGYCNLTTEFPCCSPRKEEQHGEENSQRNYDQWNKTMDQRQHRTRICRKACGSAGGQHHSRYAVCSIETQFRHLRKEMV